MIEREEETSFAASGESGDLVSIITRTKDRPVLFSRSIESVLGQSYNNWVHVVVNDGGNPGIFESQIRQFGDRYRGRVHTINNSTASGAVPALNVGLKESSSKYVVVHDDDDSWEPHFLEKSIAALQRQKKLIPNTRGVISLTTAIVEYVDGEKVVEKYRYSLNGWVQTIALTQLSAGNFFPPISFLFERDVLDAIGYFNNLKFADDWDFYLRFSSRFEIAVVHEHLANYHIRPRSTTSYSNTAAVGPYEHRALVQALRNDFLRQDLELENLAWVL